MKSEKYQKPLPPLYKCIFVFFFIQIRKRLFWFMQHEILWFIWNFSQPFWKRKKNMKKANRLHNVRMWLILSQQTKSHSYIIDISTIFNVAMGVKLDKCEKEKEGVSKKQFEINATHKTIKLRLHFLYSDTPIAKMVSLVRCICRPWPGAHIFAW